jgi:hypothetical protein
MFMARCTGRKKGVFAAADVKRLFADDGAVVRNHEFFRARRLTGMSSVPRRPVLRNFAGWECCRPGARSVKWRE